MPGVTQLLKAEAAQSIPKNPEDEILCLPSSVNSDICYSCCITDLPSIECRLHLGQADDTLNEVQRQLRVTSSIIQFKCSQHQASQQLSRKSQALMAKFTNKTHQAVRCYIAAHEALHVERNHS